MNYKPISLGSRYVMKPGASYYDICQAMRLDESEIPVGLLALQIINGPEYVTPTLSAHAPEHQYFNS
jgi:hypothetical protein